MWYQVCVALILSLQVGYVVGSRHVLHQDLPILHLVFEKAQPQIYVSHVAKKATYHRHLPRGGGICSQIKRGGHMLKHRRYQLTKCHLTSQKALTQR